jgi:hypothetical protein
VSTPEGRGDAWPVPERPPDRSPLPRVDDLPQSEHGYDPERVREAFDAFYRHIAQMDTTLRTLEAVDTFRHQAGALRQELRALRAAGWSQQPWGSGYGGAPRRSGPGLPDALPRLGLEAGFIVLVAVLVAVLHFGKVAVILTLLLAWAVVGVVEWIAARERYTPPPPVSPQGARAARPARAAAPAAALPPPAAPASIADAAGWAAYSEPSPAESEALTFVAESESDSEPEVEVPNVEAEASVEPEPASGPVAEAEAEEPQLVPAPVAQAEAEVEPTPEPEQQAGAHWSWGEGSAEDEEDEPNQRRRRRWLRLRRREVEDDAPESEQPRHVRVLRAGEEPEPSLSEADIDRIVDPWEQDLDLDGLPQAEQESASPERRL